MTKLIDNKIEMENYFKEFSKSIKKGDIIALTGDLGAGKTFVVKAIAKALGIDKDKDITSPTFNIIKTYIIKNKKNIILNHFDVYRIKSVTELVDIGYYEYINDKSAINIIEWADMIKSEIPKGATWINIEVIEDIDNKEKRKVSIKKI